MLAENAGLDAFATRASRFARSANTGIQHVLLRQSLAQDAGLVCHGPKLARRSEW